MRRRFAERREISADTKYNSQLVAKFINILMNRGKKALAERVVYGAFDLLQGKTPEDNVIKVFNKAIDNVRPRLEVRPRRVGGATYQIPLEVPSHRGASLAMRWIRDFANSKRGKPMVEKLADELLLAYKGEGPAMKKKDETHKMAEANRAFAHLRW